MKREIRDMIVVITGASAGIGRALAENLASRGAKLVLGARRGDRLEELNQSLGGGHLCVVMDVAKEEDCRRLIEEAVKRFGRIDTLVCNAGYGMSVPVAEMPEGDLRAMFQTNVFGTTDCVRAAVPVMEKQSLRDGWRGQIVIVSSAAARRGLPFFGVYSATKAAQLSLAEALRVELKPVRIGVTSVHPVGTNTDFFTTAAKRSAYYVPVPGTGEIRQSPATVARKIVKGIEKPTTEVWPLRVARWGLGFSAMMPSITDWVMGRYRGEMQKKSAG